MNDTTPEMAKKMRELIQKKTPSERMHMGSSMHATSRKLIIQAIMRENPTISPLDLKKQLFLKFYGNDYTEEQKQKILAHFDLHG